MWTLILVFTITGRGISSTTVDGITSQQACETAKQQAVSELTTNVFDVHAICVVKAK
jgi:hypothetical protein